jgi:sugar phosphate isomerase/epimerase
MIQFGLSTSVFGAVAPGAREWDLAAEHGFRNIELVLPPNLLAPDKRQILSAVHASAKNAGITIGSLSVGLADATVALAVTNELNCSRLVIRAGTCRLHSGDARGPAPDGHALRRALEPVAVQADHSRITTAIEFPAAWPAQTVIDWLEAMDAPALGVCLDLGHTHLNEGAPEAIEQLAGYTRTLHVHDNLGRTDEHRLPFAGSIDWPAILMELEKTGYAGPMTIELPQADPDLAGVLTRAVGARTRLQAILDDLAQPMVFPE